MITRLEIIDDTKDLDKGGGRTVIVDYTEGKVITYDLQDDDRTLKVFIGRPTPKTPPKEEPHLRIGSSYGRN